MIKKTIKLAITALMLSNIATAQDFQGKAYYISKMNMSEGITLGADGIATELPKEIKDQIQKIGEKNFILTFDKTKSIYEEQQKLATPTQGDVSINVISFSNETKKLYKDLKNKKSVSQSELLGREYLITDSIASFNWKMENETKKIGGYDCYKAVCIIPVSKEKRKEYEDYVKEHNNSKTTFFYKKEPEDKVITAWYTPEIQVSNGPDEYGGLPGLILEANFEKTTILCSKIVLNPKEKISIQEPVKGKKVTKKEFSRLVKEKESTPIKFSTE